MTNIDTLEREALVLFLRSKTALGRLNDSEVHSVLTFLEGIGFAHQAAAPAAPVQTAVANAAPQDTVQTVGLVAPAPAVLTPDMQVAAQLAQVFPIPPAPVAPVSMLANLESIIEKDVKAFFAPAPEPVAAPITPPPAQ